MDETQKLTKENLMLARRVINQTGEIRRLQKIDRAQRTKIHELEEEISPAYYTSRTCVMHNSSGRCAS